MRIDALCGPNNDGHIGAQAAGHEVAVHAACREDHRQGALVRRYGLVSQNDLSATGKGGFFRLGADAVEVKSECSA